MGRELPQNWVETDLDTIVLRMSNGSGLKQFEEDFDGAYPISRIETIWNETIDLDRVKYVQPTEADIKKYSLQKGDVLFSHINSDKHLGKTAVFNLNITIIHGINLLLLRPCSQFNGDLLNYLLRHYRFSGKFIEVAQRSVNQSSINQKKLKSFPAPLIPLPEQTRIVAKLDQLFGQLEQINESLENLQSIKSRFLYSCLVDQKKNEFFKRLKIGQFLQEGTERIGAGWEECRLIGVSAKEGITDLRVGQKKTFEKYKVVRKGDFIYNTMRVNIGSIAIYKGDVPAITSPDYVVFRANAQLSSDLLLGFLKSDQGLLEIGANTKGSVRARLYFKSLTEIRMPYGGIKIQELAQQFLHFYNEALQKMEDILADKIPQLEQAILHKAFKGELVYQLDSDGDARQLLKEIEMLRKEVKLNKSKKAKLLD